MSRPCALSDPSTIAGVMTSGGEYLYVALNGTFLVSASWADMKLKPQVGLVAARGI